MELQYHNIFMPITEDIICYHNTSQSFQDESILPYHHHDAYEIYMFIRGNTYLYVEQSCYNLKPGDLMVIRPGELHRSVCMDNQIYERIGINIKKSILMGLSSARSDLLRCFESRPFGLNNLVQLSQSQMAHYTAIVDKLIACLASEEYGQDILGQSYLAQLLVWINTVYQGSTYSSANIMPKLVTDTMTYIKEHLTEAITSEDLERTFNYSSKHISQLFKYHTGITIRSYILDQRITLAKTYLSIGKSVAEACELSGFNDYANFIRSFKNIVGIPPGMYKSNRNKKG